MLSLWSSVYFPKPHLLGKAFKSLASLTVPLAKTKLSISTSELKTSPSLWVTSRYCVYTSFLLWHLKSSRVAISGMHQMFKERFPQNGVCDYCQKFLGTWGSWSLIHMAQMLLCLKLPEGVQCLGKGWSNRSECPEPPLRRWDRKNPGAKSSSLRRWHTGWVWICHSMNLKFLDLNSAHRTCPCLPSQEPGSYSCI